MRRALNKCARVTLISIMVSGVTSEAPAPAKYKPAKKGFFQSSSAATSPPPQQPSAVAPQLHHQPNAGKRFSDSDLRPWPPMYNGRAVRPSDENFRSLASSNGKGNANFKNASANGGGKKGASGSISNNNYNHSIYDRNKYNFHGNGGGKSVTSASSMVSSNGNSKSAKDYYMLSQPYVMNSLSVPSDGSLYGGSHGGSRDVNLLMVAKEREKSRFRKLR